MLIEEHLDGPRLGTLEVFEIASEGSARAFGMLEAIAYVDVNAEGDLRTSRAAELYRGPVDVIIETLKRVEQDGIDEGRAGP